MTVIQMAWSAGGWKFGILMPVAEGGGGCWVRAVMLVVYGDWGLRAGTKMMLVCGC